MAPFVLPKLPSRVYFRFGQPISLENVDKANRVECQRIYDTVKASKSWVGRQFVDVCPPTMES